MKIANLFPNKQDGKIKAFFTLEIPDKLVIRDCKLIQSDSGELFAAMPSRQYTDKKDGKQKWAGVVQILDNSLLDKITALARKEYDANVGGHTPQGDSDIPF